MKKVLFLIRGLGREQRHWGGFLEVLKARFPDLDLECIDLPGFGDQAFKRSPASIEGISKDVLSTQILDKYEGYDEKYILGLSLGGMVSLQLMKLKSGYFTGVVVMNSSQKYKTSPFKRLNLSFLPKAVYGSLFSSVKTRESIVYDMTVNSGEKEKAETVTSWVEIYKSAPYKTESFLRQLRAGARFTVKGWENQRQKGMVLTSSKDRLVCWESSKRIAELMDWPLEVNNNAGHDLSFDEPDWICNKIADFFKK